MNLELAVVTLRYSSWSIRPWLALTHSGLPFTTRTVELRDHGQPPTDDLPGRRALGSVTGLFPVLWIDGTPVHEALAICETVAELAPAAHLWPADPLQRAQARSLCSEMATGFPNLRTYLSCHPFGRVPGFVPNLASAREIERVFELWTDSLVRSGGPFLFGRFGIVDCMYFPVLTRFETYDVELPTHLRAYRDAMHGHPAVLAWRELALRSPRLPLYDRQLEALGGTIPFDGQQPR